MAGPEIVVMPAQMRLVYSNLAFAGPESACLAGQPEVQFSTRRGEAGLRGLHYQRKDAQRGAIDVG